MTLEVWIHSAGSIRGKHPLISKICPSSKLFVALDLDCPQRASRSWSAFCSHIWHLQNEIAWNHSKNQYFITVKILPLNYDQHRIWYCKFDLISSRSWSFTEDAQKIKTKFENTKFNWLPKETSAKSRVVLLTCMARRMEPNCVFLCTYSNRLLKPTKLDKKTEVNGR